ncbi:hypothetical protein EMIT0111MI5_30129 [Burkholderia sp. IT-111MI5]
MTDVGLSFWAGFITFGRYSYIGRTISYRIASTVIQTLTIGCTIIHVFYRNHSINFLNISTDDSFASGRNVP